MSSGINDAISNGSNCDLQNQPQVNVQISQRESRSLDRAHSVQVVLPDSEVSAATDNSQCYRTDKNGNTESVISHATTNATTCTRPSSTQLDLSSERADGASVQLNQEVGVTTVTNSSDFKPNTNFDVERNLAYGTNIAIAPEIETSENMAYEHTHPLETLNLQSTQQ